jgi:hypothetical protein
MRNIKEKKKTRVLLQRFAYSVGHCLFILLTGAEMEILKIKEDSKIKRQTNLDRRGPSQIGTD